MRELNASNGEFGEDPGAIENRLTVNPEDFPVIAEWVDGETYRLTELGKGVMIRQVSPGEFEIVPPAGAAAAAAAEEPLAGEEGYVNPAVENLIAKKR